MRIEEMMCNEHEAYGDDECDPWWGSYWPNGYGQCRRSIHGERHMYAHRYMWALVYDRPIPEGMVIMHTCDNPSCVNPRHLKLGTYKANTQDSIKKGRWGKNRKKSHCKRGHAMSGSNVYHYGDGKRHCRECMRIRERNRYHGKKKKRTIRA